MKTMFNSNNRGKATLYILFAVAVLSFASLFFISSMLPTGVFILVLLIALIGMMFLGSLIINLRSGPPW